jgi:hypothetical protein
MKSFVKIFICLGLLNICTGFQITDQFKYKLIIFEGSDWCPNCRRLEKTILSDSLFLNQLKSISVTVERIDFPQRNILSNETRRYNSSVAEKYAFDGNFPTLVLTRTDTLSFQRISYTNQSAEDILKQLKLKIDVLK